MTHGRATAFILTWVLLYGNGGVGAQQPEATPQALTYDMALKAMDAAEAEARRNKWNVTIVVTDAAGIPMQLRRLDGASPRS